MCRTRRVGLELDQHPSDRLVAPAVEDSRLHGHRPVELVDQRPRFGRRGLSPWEHDPDRDRFTAPFEPRALLNRDLDCDGNDYALVSESARSD